jgi:hypothetical protein
MTPDNQAVQPGIVANDGLFVAGAAYVKFKAVGAMLERKIKGGNGVFRRLEPGATMSEK